MLTLDCNWCLIVCTLQMVLQRCCLLACTEDLHLDANLMTGKLCTATCPCCKLCHAIKLCKKAWHLSEAIPLQAVGIWRVLIAVLSMLLMDRGSGVSVPDMP